ncbi:MAG: hypothetical protein ACLGPL_05625 [Acidobacteriota bacterium]
MPSITNPIATHLRRIAALVAFLVFALCGQASANSPKTMIISAEGLVDANSGTYGDVASMAEPLREDAKRQIIEKAVATYVDSSTMADKYKSIRDNVLMKNSTIIKQIVKESKPWIGRDGFGHMLMRAEVYIDQVQDALEKMSRTERIGIIKEHGDPRISVAVTVKDADRSSDVEAVRSSVAENVLKERIKSFGYRVWSEEGAQRPGAPVNASTSTAGGSGSSAPQSDFFILGEAKFKKLSHKLAASGITVSKYALTSWTVKCIDNNTGEEIYFNNKVPQKQTWPDEDVAIADIGRMIGSEFSKEFFEDHLQQSAKVYQLEVMGLPNYDAGEMIRREFIGLRPIINVNLRNFDDSGLSLYEVEFAGKRDNFNQLVNESIIKPLNAKFSANIFKLVSSHGSVVRLNVQHDMPVDKFIERTETTPPASITYASADRLRDLVKSEKTLENVKKVNPTAVSMMTHEPGSDAGNPNSITSSF